MWKGYFFLYANHLFMFYDVTGNSQGYGTRTACAISVVKETHFVEYGMLFSVACSSAEESKQKHPLSALAPLNYCVYVM